MKYASTIEKYGAETVAIVLPLGAVPGFDPECPPQPNTYAVPDEVWPGWVKEGDAFVPPPPLSTWQLQRACTEAVQARLDRFAQERGYDSIHTAAGYRGDEDPQFAAEGAYCCLMRSRTWRACYEIMGAVLSGAREAPSLEGLMAELPGLAWPDAPAAGSGGR